MKLWRQKCKLAPHDPSLACGPLQKQQCVVGAPCHVSDVNELLNSDSPLNFSGGFIWITENRRGQMIDYFTKKERLQISLNNECKCVYQNCFSSFLSHESSHNPSDVSCALTPRLGTTGLNYVTVYKVVQTSSISSRYNSNMFVTWMHQYYKSNNVI